MKLLKWIKNLLKSIMKFLKYLFNRKIYFFTIVISLTCEIPLFFNQACAFFIVLSGIGCSGIAAAIMAYFIDANEERKKTKEINVLRERYMSDLIASISTLCGRTIWMYKNLNDDSFGWCSFSGEGFFSLQHHCFIIKQDKNSPIENEITLSITELNQEIDGICCSMYGWGNYDNLSSTEKQRIKITHNAILKTSDSLAYEINRLSNNVFYLDTEKIIKKDDIVKLRNFLSNYLTYLSVDLPNSGVEVLSSMKMIISIVSQYMNSNNNKIIIGRHMIFTP